MKYATVGKENRKVYRVEEPEFREVYRMEIPEVPDGEEPTPPKLVIDKELVIPTASPHREIIKISNAKAARIAATASDHTTRWYIIDGKLTNTKP